MRALKIAGAAIAAVIVVIGLLLMIGVPSGFLTQAIQERAERETAYRLAVSGTTRLGIWPSLNVTLNDITVQDPKAKVFQDLKSIGLALGMPTSVLIDGQGCEIGNIAGPAVNPMIKITNIVALLLLAILAH